MQPILLLKRLLDLSIPGRVLPPTLTSGQGHWGYHADMGDLDYHDSSMPLVRRYSHESIPARCVRGRCQSRVRAGHGDVLSVGRAANAIGDLLLCAASTFPSKVVMTDEMFIGMNGFAGIFGGLLGYAIGHITTGLQQWQYMSVPSP